MKGVLNMNGSILSNEAIDKAIAIFRSDGSCKIVNCPSLPDDMDFDSIAAIESMRRSLNQAEAGIFTPEEFN